MIECPNCEHNIDEDPLELDEGEIIECDECGEDLVVTSIEPFEVETFEGDEDEDDEEDDLLIDDEDYDEDDEEEEDAA